MRVDGRERFTRYPGGDHQRSVLERLNSEVVRLLGETETREFFEKYGSSPRPRSMAATGEFVRDEARKAVELVKAIGATAQ